jgi:hypothetical protein
LKHLLAKANCGGNFRQAAIIRTNESCQSTLIEGIELAVVEGAARILVEGDDAVAQTGDVDVVGVIVRCGGCAGHVAIARPCGWAGDKAFGSIGEGELPCGGIDSKRCEGESSESVLHLGGW